MLQTVGERSFSAVYMIRPEEGTMKNLLFRVPGYTLGFRLNKGNPGSHSFFPLHTTYKFIALRLWNDT
jgi:hypothetical protein